MESTVYHVYGKTEKTEVIAHSLSEEELTERILKEEVQLDIHEILPLKTDLARETEQAY